MGRAGKACKGRRLSPKAFLADTKKPRISARLFLYGAGTRNRTLGFKAAEYLEAYRLKFYAYTQAYTHSPSYLLFRL